MKKILILANDVTTILQFRCELITALVEDGNEVVVSVPKNERTAEIESLGVKIVETEIEIPVQINGKVNAIAIIG